jgi:hypothetical protein
MRKMTLQAPAALAALAVFLLTSCGTLPEPFYGNPGAEGAKLATPPPPVLLIPPPGQALLGDDAAKVFASDLATTLVSYDVPSIAGPADKTDWRLNTTASLSGNNVIPSYAIIGPDGKSYGTQTGHPVAAEDWANGNPQALAAAANADAPALTKLLTGVNAAVQQSNPQSLENRPARLYLGAVTGAPTDGDSALALDIARDLPGIDTVMVNHPAHADFIITGAIQTQPQSASQILVQLSWTIRDSNGRIIGKVFQFHDLKPSDITPHWGDVAAAAASEAAAGILNVVTNATLHKKVS